MAVALTDDLAALLRRRSAGRLAQLTRRTKRTTQRWQAGESVPGADDLIGLMSDAELCAEVLRLAGQATEAERVRVVAQLSRVLAELKRAA
jgi:hypothetical protein